MRDNERQRERADPSTIVIGEAEALGRRVRDARRRQGMSQDDLAFAANVSPRTVFAIEQGKPTVRFDMLARVLAAAGLRLSAEPRDLVWLPDRNL
ncbi:MAG TPA: helix-turn-helix domain-containing protein [Solirubrobacterales bacterium]|nr:helix-turn-helix domain-containing protein [Solirubrobacterales bacterium]